MTGKKKPDTKQLQRAKLKRRRMLTFVRMYRHGINNFSRNAWLTIAATAVMSVTLLIIFVTVIGRQVLLDAAKVISQKTDISIYLRGDTDEKVARQIAERIGKLENVSSVRYISAAQARKEQAEQLKDDVDALEAIKESSNELPVTLRVVLYDLNDQVALEEFTKHDDLYQRFQDPRPSSSFKSGQRQSIKTIGEWVRIASIGGSIATLLFVVISSLVVFNTIRMAIFNRKDEIQMMKLIGAERGFIRGPFIVEAILYGFIAAIVATAAGYGLLVTAEAPLTGYGIPAAGVLQQVTTYIALILLGMIMIGSLIGTVSAWVATRKYLKL